MTTTVRISTTLSDQLNLALAEMAMRGERVDKKAFVEQAIRRKLNEARKVKRP